jgi:NADPH-dependent F420 reductase
MEIAVIGTGDVGRALGSRWSEGGHRVAFGSRNPEAGRVQEVVRVAGENAHACGIAEAAQQAEVVVLAIPWKAAERTLKEIGPLQGKILVDPMNPSQEDAFALLQKGRAAGEWVAQWAPGARVVKAFNTTGWENMADPLYDGEPLTMFLCGDDPEAKRVVGGLARELGFEALDVGDLHASWALEGLARVWINLAHRAGLGRDIGFHLLRR